MPLNSERRSINASSVVHSEQSHNLGLIAFFFQISACMTLLCGIGLIVASIALADLFFKYTNPFDTELVPYAVIIAILGCMVITSAIFGIVGMFVESRLMLYVTLVLTAIVMTIQAISAFAGFITLSQIDGITKDALTKYFSERDKNEYYNHLIDRMQKELKCCGFKGPLDYGSRPIPQSCYKKNEYFKRGCYIPVRKKLRVYMNILCAFTASTLIPEVVVVISAIIYRKYSA